MNEDTYNKHLVAYRYNGDAKIVENFDATHKRGVKAYLLDEGGLPYGRVFTVCADVNCYNYCALTFNRIREICGFRENIG